jgi:hypothetical protein
VRTKLLYFFQLPEFPSGLGILRCASLTIERDPRQNDEMNRRKLLAGLSAFLAGQTSHAQAPKRGPVFQHDLPDLTLRDWSVTTVEVHYAPGGSSTSHRHPGLTLPMC